MNRFYIKNFYLFILMGTDETTSQKNDSFIEKELSDVFEYYGINSSSIQENNSLKDEEFIINSDKKELSLKTFENKKLVPTTFEWDEGGRNIYVTGNFCQWKQFFLMKKESENHYYLTLNLPKGRHQYKFKVDGEWKFNPKFPIYNDGGYINNYLDTSKLEITIKSDDEEITAISTNITENPNDLPKLPKKMSKNISKINSELSQTQTGKQKINNICEKITPVPMNYKNQINLNLISNQKYIGEKKYIEVEEKNILSDNISFKNIHILPIERINHLNSKNEKSKPIICSISSRFRYKFTTFVYYKTIKNSE